MARVEEVFSKRDHEFESTSLQRRVEWEPDLAPWNCSSRSVPWPFFVGMRLIPPMCGSKLPNGAPRSLSCNQ